MMELENRQNIQKTQVEEEEEFDTDGQSSYVQINTNERTNEKVNEGYVQESTNETKRNETDALIHVVVFSLNGGNYEDDTVL